ncbi:Aldo/keto reductase [Ascodesmis nigricans]|uniref:Aldo/keto reductase n=1 Tax=Ascodesmis nigricans TaxID=341454 RepID=A0A4S2MT44_9PEZI|nr:Aldo/keto reductase [Ascodesmis nigricans]
MTSTIPTRKLGRNGPEVTSIGFGSMGLSTFYGPTASDSDRFTVLNAAINSGSAFIDTAHIYGDSESLIGRWLQTSPDLRSRIFLATKCGIDLSNGWANAKTRGDAEFIKQQIDTSFSRLGVDVIDLYYVHRIDSTVPIEETIRTIKEYGVDTGRIRYIGLSEASAETIRRANAVHPIAAVQVEYSPFALEIEDPKFGVLEVARELGIAVVAYSPLGRGLLTGKYRSRSDFDETDLRLRMPRFSEENFPKNLRLAEKLEAIAKRKGDEVTAGQVCLSWILSRGEDFFVIPGTKRVGIVQENNKAAQVKLTEDEIKEINEAIKECQPTGDRYGNMTGLYGDSAPKKN